jgi:hypothetical protein
MIFALQDFITYVLALVARVVTPGLGRQLSRLCGFIVGDVPQLGATWVVDFTDPAYSQGQRPVSIDANLQQFGRFLKGTGHIHGEPGDPFVYWGIIKRNAFYGTFSRKDSKVLAGTGTFILKISANSRQLQGYCSWYDNLLDDVWTSQYQWSRSG